MAEEFFIEDTGVEEMPEPGGVIDQHIDWEGQVYVAHDVSNEVGEIVDGEGIAWYDHSMSEITDLIIEEQALSAEAEELSWAAQDQESMDAASAIYYQAGEVQGQIYDAMQEII